MGRVFVIGEKLALLTEGEVVIPRSVCVRRRTCHVLGPVCIVPHRGIKQTQEGGRTGKAAVRWRW